MISNQLGSTNHTVTRIGLGLAALGRPGYINLGHGEDLSGRNRYTDLEHHARSVLDAAYGLGIRYFDTARSYGDGEAFLGRWLDEKNAMAGVDAIVASKWGYRYVADWRIDVPVHEVKEHDLASLDRQYRETRERLGEDLAIYQIHSATLESGVLDNDAVLDRLAAIKAGGVTVGLSTSGPNQAAVICRALAIERDGERLFGTVQSTWNLLETSAGSALATASAEGMGVIIKESVANGRLTERDPDSVASLRAALPDFTPDAVAIAAVLAQPFVDVVLSGAATRDQLQSNLAARSVDPDQLNRLPDMAENPEAYWARRSRLSWT